MVSSTNLTNKGKKMNEKIIFMQAIEEFPDNHDAAKANMVENGIPFSSVTRIFNKYMIETGRAMTKFERETVINSILGKGGYKSESGFNNKVERLMEKLETSKRSACAIIRSHAKKNGKKYYTPPVEDKNPRKSFMKQFCEFLEENPFAKEEQVVKFLNNDTAKYIKRNRNLYMEIWRMVQVVVRKHNNGK